MSGAQAFSQAGLGAPAPALHLADLDETCSREPRVYDLTLARALGFEHARNIRRLISGNRAELETHGALVAVDDHSGGDGNLLRGGANRRAGRPGRAFYLNEGQSLVVCALTRTPAGAKVRGELIRVFMLHRACRMTDVRPADFAPLVRRDRLALREIVSRADVVLAPPSYEVHATGDAAPAIRAADGHIGYLLAPVTERLLDLLSLFEAADVDLEDGGDLGENGDEEDGPDDSGIGDAEGLAEQCGHVDEEPDREPNGDETDGPDDNGVADLDGLNEQLSRCSRALARIGAFALLPPGEVPQGNPWTPESDLPRAG